MKNIFHTTKFHGNKEKRSKSQTPRSSYKLTRICNSLVFNFSFPMTAKVLWLAICFKNLVKLQDTGMLEESIFSKWNTIRECRVERRDNKVNINMSSHGEPNWKFSTSVKIHKQGTNFKIFKDVMNKERKKILWTR